MIRVGFSHGKGFRGLFSRIIMKFMGRPYSHTWLLLDGPHGFRGNSVILESTLEGFRLVPYETYDKTNVIVKIIDPPFPLDSGVDKSISLLGEEYDTPGLFGMIWVILFRKWFHKKIRNPFRNSHSMWCSEAVAFIIKSSENYPNAVDIDPGRMSPEDVEDLLALKTIE